MKIGMAYFEFGGSKGIARVAEELTTRIASLGHEVHFHCVNPPPEIKIPNIHFHHTGGVNSFSTIGLSSFAYFAGKDLHRHRYDITHSHGNIVGSDVITAHSCHIAGLRVADSPFNFGLADKVRLWIEQKNYGGRRFKKIIAVSEGVKRELMQEYNLRSSEIIVIPNGVDLERFNTVNAMERKHLIRRQLGFADDDFVLIFVANEFKRKGLSFAIDAFSHLKEKRARLLVVGDDRMAEFGRKVQQEGLSQQVRFTGGVNNIRDYYAASDAFIFPTSYEAFSLATLEAAASGLPLLTTKVNGTEELIEKGVNGLFVEQDGGDIAEKVETLMSDATLRNTMGANARRSAERYSWDSIARRTIEVYEQIQ